MNGPIRILNRVRQRSMIAARIAEAAVAILCTYGLFQRSLACCPRRKSLLWLLSAKLGQSEWPLASKQKQMNVSAIPASASITTKSKTGFPISRSASNNFGQLPDQEIRGLRYQLVHSAAASVIAAERHNAKMAVLLVHEFISPGLSFRKLKQNADDWTRFVRALPHLADSSVHRDQILGPFLCRAAGS